MPEPESLRAALADYFRDINEIVVHALDFKYFYNANRELYVDYLWESWATVPSVLANPEHYLLRTFAVISTTQHGSPTERFHQAFGFVKTRIECFSFRVPRTRFWVGCHSFSAIHVFRPDA